MGIRGRKMARKIRQRSAEEGKKRRKRQQRSGQKVRKGRRITRTEVGKTIWS